MNDIILKELPNKKYSEILYRLAKGFCELCGRKGNNGTLEIHHIRKLKDEIEKHCRKQLPEWLAIMKKMHRKSLVLCDHCHINLHKI